MSEEKMNVQMAASAARETAALVAENPAQKLIAGFESAIEAILGKKPGDAFAYETQGRWIVLSVYLTGSQKRKFFKKPDVVRRGILASYLNTPFKVKEEPHGLAGHWFRVVALLREK